MLFSRLRLPSPAIIVSIIALVFAVSGSAYAANKINGKQIKRGTITGKQIKRNTLTGVQIKESKLGTVPKANVAASAGDSAKLAGLDPSAFARTGNFVRVFERMNIGEADRTLVTNGDISVKMRCLKDGSNDRLVVYAVSNTAGALLESEQDDFDPLNPGADPLDSEISEGISTLSGGTSFDDGYDDTGFVISADSSRLITLLEGSSSKIVNRSGFNCIYGGTFIVQ